MRNNNPGNLKITSINWLGKIPVVNNTDGVFEQFTNYIYGIRALIMDVRNDINEGTNTINDLIDEFSATDQEAYKEFISQFTGLDINETLQADQTTLSKIIPAIGYFENGTEAITNNQFNQAYNLI